MSEKFVLATHNPGKLKEMGTILSRFGVEVASPGELGIAVEVEETGTTFAENAMLKAKAICAAAGLPAIADDSGLCVDALGGGPGIYSARYGGEGLDDAGRYRLLLSSLRGHHPGGPFRLRHRLRLPQWRHIDGGGALRRHHRLRPHGRGRLWLRPGVLRAGTEKDLRPAFGGGKERHFPQREGTGRFCGKTCNISQKINV